MTAGGSPGAKVLLDDSTGTFPYDISSYVRGAAPLTMDRGRGDELSSIQPGNFGASLENTDGRFTLGSTVGYASGIYCDQQIRYAVTVPGPANTNLIGAAGADFETGTIGSWVASGGASLANDSTRAYSGTKSMLITWPTGGSPVANLTVGGLTVGQPFTAQVRLWSAAGVPSVGLSWRGNTVATTAAGAGTWQWLYVSGVATATSHTMQIFAGGTTAGQQTWADAAMLNIGATPGVFNTVSPQTFTRYTGFVQSWPTTWPDASDQYAVAQVAAVDAMARWARRTLRSVIEEEVAVLGPSATYPLGEPAGAAGAADTSGNAAPMLRVVGSGTGVTFGSATGPSTDGFTAAQFASGKWLKGPLPTSYGGTNFSLAVFFSTTNAARTTMLCFQSGSLSGTSYYYPIDISSSGVFVGASPALSTTNWCDGNTHSLILTFNGSTVSLYIDGNLQGTQTGSPIVPAFLNVGGPTNAELGLTSFTGVLAQLCLFPATLTLGDALNYAFAGSTGYGGELGPSRISRLVKYEGSVVSTVLDAGLTTIPFVELTGKSVGDAIQAVADAEVGKAYVDGQGRAVFHNRQRAAGKLTPDLTLSVDSDVISGDTAFVADMQQVINYATGRRDGDDTAVTQVASSTTSQTRHGRYPQDYTLLVSTDAEVADRIGWIVNTHAEPAPRLPSLTLDLLSADVATQAAVMALDLDSRVRITGLPGQAPGGTTFDLVVEGFSESLSADEWTLTINASAWSLVQVAVLNDPVYGVLGSTTRLAI